MKKIILSIAAFLPSVALAQQITGSNSITNFDTLVGRLTNIGNVVIELLIAFAVIYIIVTVVRFIMSDGEKRGELRTSILWGIVGLFVILSIWGLVRILTNTFRTDNRNIPSQINGEVPRIPLPGTN